MKLRCGQSSLIQPDPRWLDVHESCQQRCLLKDTMKQQQHKIPTSTFLDTVVAPNPFATGCRLRDPKTFLKVSDLPLPQSIDDFVCRTRCSMWPCMHTWAIPSHPCTVPKPYLLLRPMLTWENMCGRWDLWQIEELDCPLWQAWPDGAGAYLHFGWWRHHSFHRSFLEGPNRKTKSLVKKPVQGGGHKMRTWHWQWWLAPDKFQYYELVWIF